MNKKGFTLVELLAVIGLIAAFALITIPTVDSLIKKQKQKLYEGHKKNITEALKTWGNMNIDSLPDEDEESITVDLRQLKVVGLIEDNMTNPKTNKCYANTNTFTITKEKNGYVYVVSDLVDGSNSDCSLEYEEYANGEAVYFNPITGKECSSTNAVSIAGTKTGCMKWYAFNDSTTSNTVNLILDHNTTAVVQWNSTGQNNEMNEINDELENLVSSFNWQFTPRLISADEIATITGNNEFNSSTSTYADSYFVGINEKVSAYEGAEWIEHQLMPNELLIQQGRYAWLLNNLTDCEGFGCNIEDEYYYEDEFGETQVEYMVGYWTSSRVVGDVGGYNCAWFISFMGAMQYFPVEREMIGVRPVIEVPKNILIGE